MSINHELEEDDVFIEDEYRGKTEPKSFIKLFRPSSPRKAADRNSDVVIPAEPNSENRGRRHLPEAKDADDHQRKLERLYAKLGMFLYKEIEGGASGLQVDGLINKLVSQISVLKKTAERFEAELLNQRFERMESRLEQLSDHLLNKPAREQTDTSPEPPDWEHRFAKIETMLQNVLRQSPQEPKIKKKEVTPPQEKELVTSPKSTPPRETINKMRQSLLDLQSIIKPGERKSQPVDTPAAETEPLFPPDPGWPVKEVQESPVPVQEPLSDPPAGDNPLIDSSNQGRLEENRLYLELAAEIPDSADRLSYIQSLRDLQAESPTTKIAAAQSLAKWPVPTTENSLISAWKIEKDSKVRMEIIELLKIQNSGKILIAFQEFLQRPDPRSQLAALEGFNRYGSDEGMRSIVKALRSEHQMVRRRAVTYIGWSMHRKALPELVKLLRDPSAYVRKTTVMVVASFGDPSSVLFLLDALDDQDRSIRTLVYKTLKNMSGKDFGYDPGADHHQRLEAIIAWKRWWRANERTLKLRPLEPAAEPPDREVAAARKEKQEEAGPETGKVPRSPAGEKKTVVKTAPQIRPPRSPKPAAAQAAAAGKKAADAGALPNGSLEQKMYEILLKKPTKGMTIQDIGSSLNLPWQKLIQKTGLLQKTGWIYKDQNHHLFFPVLK